MPNQRELELKGQIYNDGVDATIWWIDRGFCRLRTAA
jgi:hypothetical protein